MVNFASIKCLIWCTFESTKPAFIEAAMLWDLFLYLGSVPFNVFLRLTVRLSKQIFQNWQTSNTLVMSPAATPCFKIDCKIFRLPWVQLQLFHRIQFYGRTDNSLCKQQFQTLVLRPLSPNINSPALNQFWECDYLEHTVKNIDELLSRVRFVCLLNQQEHMC